jgi:hypothetical protein
VHLLWDSFTVVIKLYIRTASNEYLYHVWIPEIKICEFIKGSAWYLLIDLLIALPRVEVSQGFARFALERSKGDGALESQSQLCLFRNLRIASVDKFFKP